MVYFKLRRSLDEWCMHVTMLLPVLGAPLTKGCVEQNLKLKCGAYSITCDTCLHCKKRFTEGRGVFTKLRWAFTLKSCFIPCMLGRGQFLPSWLRPLSIEITFSYSQWGVLIVYLHVFLQILMLKPLQKEGSWDIPWIWTLNHCGLGGFFFIYVTCVYLYALLCCSWKYGNDFSYCKLL